MRRTWIVKRKFVDGNPLRTNRTPWRRSIFGHACRYRSLLWSGKLSLLFYPINMSANGHVGPSVSA